MKEFCITVKCNTTKALAEALEQTAAHARCFPLDFSSLSVDDDIAFGTDSGAAAVTLTRSA